MEEIKIKTNLKNEMIDISQKLENCIEKNNWESGILYLNVMHTTAALTINENADPHVKIDLINALEKLIPDINFLHMEGNSDAHIKSSLLGTSLTVPVSNKKLVLGVWQGIYFCEFDGPRNRKVMLNFMKF